MGEISVEALIVKNVFRELLPQHVGGPSPSLSWAILHYRDQLLCLSHVVRKIHFVNAVTIMTLI